MMDEKPKMLSRKERLRLRWLDKFGEKDSHYGFQNYKQNNDVVSPPEKLDNVALKQDDPKRFDERFSTPLNIRSKGLTPTPAGRQKSREFRTPAREIPKDPRYGIENEWQAVLAYRDQMDNYKKYLEYSVDKQKRKLYRDELDEQSRFNEMRKRLETEQQRSADTEMVELQRLSLMQESLREKQEIDTMKRLYEKAITSNINDKIRSMAKQKADALIEKRRIREEMERSIREAEEAEKRKKLDRRKELSNYYEEQEQLRRELQQLEREQDKKQYLNQCAEVEAREQKYIDQSQQLEEQKKALLKAALDCQVAHKKSIARENYFMNPIERKLNKSLIDGYRDGALVQPSELRPDELKDSRRHFRNSSEYRPTNIWKYDPIPTTRAAGRISEASAYNITNTTRGTNPLLANVTDLRQIPTFPTNPYQPSYPNPTNSGNHIQNRRKSYSSKV